MNLSQLTDNNIKSTVIKYKAEFFQPDEDSKSGMVGNWIEGITDSDKTFVIKYAKKQLKESTQYLTALRIIKVIIKTTTKSSEIYFIKK